MTKIEYAKNSILYILSEFPGSTFKEIEFYSGLCEFETHLVIRQLIKLDCVHYFVKNRQKHFYIRA